MRAVLHGLKHLTSDIVDQLVHPHVAVLDQALDTVIPALADVVIIVVHVLLVLPQGFMVFLLQGTPRRGILRIADLSFLETVVRSVTPHDDFSSPSKNNLVGLGFDLRPQGNVD